MTRYIDNRTLDVTEFGARPDGSDSAPGIQKAIDKANSLGGGVVVIPAGVWSIGLSGYVSQLSGTTLGVAGIVLKDNVRVVGTSKNASTLQLIPGQGDGAGTFGRIVTSQDGQRLNNASLSHIGVDGDSANHTPNTQFSNVLIESGSGVSVDNVLSVNSRGEGFMVRGVNTNPSEDISVTNCTSSNNARIGIQVSHVTGSVIGGNIISECGDNGIDIYGDNTPAQSSTNNVSIVNNVVRRCASGIFPETCQRVAVSGNDIYECRSAGVRMNRINSAPGGLVSANNISDTPTGIAITGDQDGTSILSNSITRPSLAGLQFGLPAGNISNIVASNNTVFDDSGNAVPWLKVEGVNASFILATLNYMRGCAPAQVSVSGTSTQVTAGDPMDWGSGPTATPNTAAGLHTQLVNMGIIS